MSSEKNGAHPVAQRSGSSRATGRAPGGSAGQSARSRHRAPLDEVTASHLSCILGSFPLRWFPGSTEVEGQRLLHSIRFTNILSYGSEMEELRLEPLNVFIGTNASGKSKRLEAEALYSWLDRYQLGEVWQMGELGGNRW